MIDWVVLQLIAWQCFQGLNKASFVAWWSAIKNGNAKLIASVCGILGHTS